MNPNEVAIPAGEGGQTRPGVILCHQVRTVSLLRARRNNGAIVSLGYVINPTIRAGVRRALARQFGLDLPPALDAAADTAYFRP